MARPKLEYSNQPLPIRLILGLYEFFASLKLAVVLIFSLAVILAFATFIEAHQGTSAVQWYVYHTWWFMGFLGLLGLNIFCAAAIRFPWKRHQTGFVITHIGLLVLLAGSAISYRGSLNSQMLVFKNGSSRTAIDQDEGTLVVSGLPGRAEPLEVRFRPGPFNWGDRQSLFSQGIDRLKEKWGWGDAPRDRTPNPQLLYEQDDVKVEVVDFYAKSDVVRVPFVDLHFRVPEFDANMPVRLEYDSHMGFAEEDFAGLGSVLLWRTRSASDWRAFTECIPTLAIDRDGEGAVVLWIDGEVHQVSLARLKSLKESGERHELNDRYQVELTAYALHADVQKLVRGEGLVSVTATGRTRCLPSS